MNRNNKIRVSAWLLLAGSVIMGNSLYELYQLINTNSPQHSLLGMTWFISLCAGVLVFIMSLIVSSQEDMFNVLNNKIDKLMDSKNQ